MALGVLNQYFNSVSMIYVLTFLQEALVADIVLFHMFSLQQLCGAV